MHLETKQIEDWADFIEENDIDLSCTACQGTGEAQHECPICAAVFGAGEGVISLDHGPVCDDCAAKYAIEGDPVDAESCENCGGIGHVEPLSNYIFNTRFHPGHADFTREPAGNVVAFEWNDEVWLGLTCVGQDNTPYLALAWLNLRPDVRWLPDNFRVTGCNLTGPRSYYEICLGKVDAARVLAVHVSGLAGEIAALQCELGIARETLAHLTNRKQLVRPLPARGITP